MKAILVLDEMPKRCLSCPISLMEDEYSGENICFGIPNDGYIPYDIYFNDRPDWCPLRPLPEHKAEMDYLATGWNLCLDTIEEGEG